MLVLCVAVLCYQPDSSSIVCPESTPGRIEEEVVTPSLGVQQYRLVILLVVPYQHKGFSELS